MTRSDKPVTRVTYATHQGREIVATIHKSYLQLRLKGTKQMATLDIEAAYEFALKAEANARRNGK